MAVNEYWKDYYSQLHNQSEDAPEMDLGDPKRHTC